MIAPSPPAAGADASGPTILVTAPSSPDIAPMRDAVAACDRAAMAGIAKAEPHRRAGFAISAYAEQRAIAAERGALAPSATTAAGKAGLEAARAAIDARQKRLDDARAVEQAWRAAVDELRLDYLANCDGKRG